VLGLAPAASAFQFGIEDDSVLYDRYGGDPQQVFDRGKQLGASVVRMMVPWGQVETARGRYDWAKLDAAVRGARARGFRVQLTLGGTPTPPPAWRGTLARPSVGGFARFARQAAGRYRGRVAEYGLYNEPDWSKVPPALYRRLYQAGRRAVRARDPHARVLFGELSGARPIEYTCLALRRGPVRSEGFAWHPYQWTRPPAQAGGRREVIGIGKAAVLARFLKTTRLLATVRGKPLGMYGTEFGYLTRGKYKLSPRRAARWWPQALRQARRTGMRELIAYQMVAAVDDWRWDSSLLDADGQPRPAFLALERLETR
jgi:hypothetical protein